MKAVRIFEHGGLEVLKYEQNVPIPTLDKKQVLVKKPFHWCKFHRYLS